MSRQDTQKICCLCCGQGDETEEDLLTASPVQPASPNGRASQQRPRLEERQSWVTGRGKFVPNAAAPEAPGVHHAMTLLVSLK